MKTSQSSLSITALFFLNCIGIGFLFVSGSVHASIFTHIWELLNLPEVFMLVSLFENISTFSQYNGPFCYIALKSDFRLLQDIQLNPTLTDFLGPIMLFCYRWTSVIANKGSKKVNLKGPWICVCYRRNSVGGGSVRAGFNCIWRLPSKGDICVSKKIKIEKMYKWKCKKK